MINPNLNSKLKYLLIQANISFEDGGLKTLDKKSIKIIIELKKDLGKLDLQVNELKELNTIWKLNTVLARFVYKYSSFAENYVLALIQNCEISNRKSFISILNKNKKRFQDQKDKMVKGDKRNLIESKISTCNKAINKVDDLKKLKFVEKCEVYKQMYKSKQFSITNVDPKLFSKIRTFRNKAVHSIFIIEYFIDTTPLKHLASLYELVDEKYRKQFIREEKRIFWKYRKPNKFKLLSLKHL